MLESLLRYAQATVVEGTRSRKIREKGKFFSLSADVGLLSGF